jgi:tetratricopeptide (TPR) repeat protein
VPAAALLAGMGLTWRANRRYDTALDLWEATARAAPDLPFPHYQTGYFSQLAGILTSRGPGERGAIQEYLEALSLDRELAQQAWRGMPPDQKARALLNLGLILAEELPPRLRDPGRAKRYLLEAAEVASAFVNLDWEWASALRGLARLRHRPEAGIGVEEARGYLQLALALEFEDPDLREALRRELDTVENELPR